MTRNEGLIRPRLLPSPLSPYAYKAEAQGTPDKRLSRTNQRSINTVEDIAIMKVIFTS